MIHAKGSHKDKHEKGKGPRPENPYKPVNCAADGDAGCKELNDWGKAWEQWGQTLLKELDEMKLAICNLEKKVYYNVTVPGGLICNATGPIGGAGGPPTDSGQPPKPPFK